MSALYLLRAQADLVEALRVMQDARDMLRTAEREYGEASDELELAQAAYDAARAQREAEENGRG